MRYGRWFAVLAAGMLASGLVGVTASLADARSFQDDQRLLPGTSIAGVEVGEQRAHTAIETVEAHLEPQLETEVELVVDDRRWTTSAAALDADPDIEGAVDTALASTRDAGLMELSWLRLRGDTADVEVAVDTNIDGDALDHLVSTIANEIETAPRDAAIEWDGQRVELTEAREGTTLDREVARQRIESAVLVGRDVELPIERIAPEVTTDALAPVADQVNDLAAGALDREIRVTAADAERTLTPRELGVEPDLEAVRQAVRDADGATISAAALPDAPTDLPLDVPTAAVDEVVADLAAEIEQPARDAELDWSTGELQVIEGRTGRSLDTEVARSRVDEAIRGATDNVELQPATTQPAVTTDDYDRVLFLRTGQRTLQLYQDGEVIREWQVAVGQPSSPTPTGVFTVGQKRYEPTWTNPDPDGWGSDMPDVIGPGPDNPLGVRALNWNQNGRDTLIRFHGSNQPDSIGRAASQGCVRLTNEDVTELYDLVPSGTTIVSTAG